MANIYDYQSEINKTLRFYNEGSINLEQANTMLKNIENIAYQTNLNSEPDGDITYSVATAFEEINK